jgi:hypothetical protein
VNITRIETSPIIASSPPDPWDSLPRAVQAKVLEEHRDDDVQDEWYDFLFEDFSAIAETLCISIADQGKNGKAINFQSYPWGCSFDGMYGPSGYKQSPQDQFSLARLLIRAEYPADKELHRIADGLYEVQSHNGWAIVAQVKSIGRDTHSRNTSIDVQLDETEGGWLFDDRELSDSDAEEVSQLLRDFMDWMASQLETEHDDLTSDEYVIERVREGVIDLSEYVVEAPQARYRSEYQQEENDNDE